MLARTPARHVSDRAVARLARCDAAMRVARADVAAVRNRRTARRHRRTCARRSTRFRRIVQALRAGRAGERRAGLSSAQLFALQQIAEHPGASINDVAALTFTHQSSVSVVIQRLVDSGSSPKVPASDDRRRQRARGDGEGRRALRRAPVAVQEHLIAAIAALPRPTGASRAVARRDRATDRTRLTIRYVHRCFSKRLPVGVRDSGSPGAEIPPANGSSAAGNQARAGDDLRSQRERESRVRKYERQVPWSVRRRRYFYSRSRSGQTRAVRNHRSPEFLLSSAAA